MKVWLALAGLFVLSNVGWCGAVLVQRQDQSQPPDRGREAGTGLQDAGQQRGTRADRDGRRRPVWGKISAIGSDSIEITGPDGSKVTLKLTGSTEFRKDRQPAKLTDF